MLEVRTDPESLNYTYVLGYFILHTFILEVDCNSLNIDFMSLILEDKKTIPGFKETINKASVTVLIISKIGDFYQDLQTSEEKFQLVSFVKQSLECPEVVHTSSGAGNISSSLADWPALSNLV